MTDVGEEQGGTNGHLNWYQKRSAQKPVLVAAFTGWNDAGNTPNVHYVCFDTGEFPTLIALSNLNNEPGGRSSWKTKADRPFDRTFRPQPPGRARWPSPPAKP